MFDSELLNQIINAIPSESSAVKVKALCLFTLLDSLGQITDDYANKILALTNDIRIVLED